MSKRKHRFSALLVLLLIIALPLFLFTGCKQELTTAEIGSLYTQAIKNSLNERFYFWQEYVYGQDSSEYNEVNVWSEKDADSKPVLDADGKLKDSYIRIYETKDSKPVAEYYWGKSKATKDGAQRKEGLFFTQYGEATAIKWRQDVDREEFYNSDLFRPYLLSSRMGEWKNLTVEDMDFQIDQGLKVKNLHVVELQFRISDAYLEEYKEKNGGKTSIFEGSSYVAVEISYDRIASLTIFEKRDLGGNMVVDSEKYKFQTVYLGPKLQENNLPVYDASHTVDGVQVPLWKEHKIID